MAGIEERLGWRLTSTIHTKGAMRNAASANMTV
jgi:hypothetical protein